MDNLDRIVARLEKVLDGKDRAREEALKRTRALTRVAGTAIRRMHRGEPVRREFQTMRTEVQALRALLRARHPDLWYGGFVEGALQEVAEAAIVRGVLEGSRLPDPRALGVTHRSYVLGLADAIGELRRLSLDRMRIGRVDEATRFVELMEELYHALMRFDYPDAVVAVRHKQDIARSLLERTRGELAVAARSAELERKLAELTRRRR